MARRWLSPEDASDLGRLDAEAIARVQAEAWPDPTNTDELHDAMVWLGFITDAEAQAPNWQSWLAELAQQKRAAKLATPAGAVWITAERLPHLEAIGPMRLDPVIAAPAGAETATRDEALVEILRGRLEGLGPVTQEALAAPLGLGASDSAAALAALETEGFAMRGRFTRGAGADEWCE